jgi:hypothetical protein
MQPRPSLSLFLEEQFEAFVQADTEAYNEAQVKDSVLPKLFAISGRNGPQRSIRFTNLAPLDGFTNDKLKQAQPDYYFGAPPEQLNQNVRSELSKYISFLRNQVIFLLCRTTS